MTEQELVLELATHRIKRYLKRVKRESQAKVYNSCGRGSNPQEYNAIINQLIADGNVTRSFSERNAAILTWVEQPTEV
jgi:hypothetical protein